MPVDEKEFIQFGVQRLRIPVLGSLDEEGHQPYGECRHCMPIKALAIEDEPQQGIGDDNAERHRARCPGSKARQE